MSTPGVIVHLTNFRVGLSVGRSVVFFFNFHYTVTPVFDDLGVWFFVCILPEVYTSHCHFDIFSWYDCCRDIIFFFVYIFQIYQKHEYYECNIPFFVLKQVNLFIFVAYFWSLSCWMNFLSSWNLALELHVKAFFLPPARTYRTGVVCNAYKWM